MNTAVIGAKPWACDSKLTSCNTTGFKVIALKLINRWHLNGQHT